MDIAFKRLLVRLSLKAAEESRGDTRDLFLSQAARLESEMGAFTLAEFNAYAAKNPPQKTNLKKLRKAIRGKHPRN